MKIINLKYLALFVLPLLFFACSKDGGSDLRAKGEGVLDLHFGYDLAATPVSKADGDPIFAITVKNFATGVIVKSVEDHTTLAASPMTLKAGKYIIIASNGSNADAEFESPYYEGRDTVEMVSGKTTSSSFECTLANVKVAVAMSEAVTSNFTTYDVTVENGEGGVLVFDKEHLTSYGYFKCTGTLKWTINLVNTDGEVNSISNTISNVKPREYYRICFDVNGNSGSDQGGATLRVSYDSSVSVKEYGIDISLNKKAMPTITEASGANLSSTLRAPLNAGVIGLFNINSAAGFSDITVSHNEAAFTALGIPTSFSMGSADAVALSSAGIVLGAYSEGGNSTTIDFRELFSKKLDLGSYAFKISVTDVQNQHISIDLRIVVIPDVEISMINVDAWGKFAYVYAQYNTESEPAGMGFKYKKSSDSEWTVFTGALIRDGAKYSAKITGLSPNTAYDFMAVSTKDEKDDNKMSATTSGVSQLPFSNYDTWIEIDKAYFPTDNLDNLFFDSANKATGGMGVNPTTQDTDFKVSGSSARLESCSVMGAMAAGNLYTGYFVERNGLNAKVSFGRPYTDRPIALHGYYNYAPKAINKVKSPYTNLNGQNDFCQIYVMLTNWSEPWVVDSGQKNFVDPTADYVIAYGELSDNTTTGAEFKEFTINLEYKSNQKPTHIVVVSVASKYGDYFTGGVGSVLWVDEFSLLFE